MRLSLAIWSAVTLAHVLLTIRATRRFLSAGDSFDKLVFAAAVLIVGGLSMAAHLAALTAGLDLASGTVFLGAWHLVLWRASSRRSSIAVAPSGFLERVSIWIWIAVALSWIDGASRADAVFGPDAAHYHVPHAVNFAAGGRLFDVPATPHLYPMAGSVVSAWFIVATGDLLLVDLAMLLPFAALVSALLLIFRSTTGQSGVAWCTWLCLLLFSTPMFRSSSMGAADLWFAAGFVSLLAVMVITWAQRAWTSVDFVLAGISAGLLLGSKASGAPSFVLLAAGFLLMSAMRRLGGSARVAIPQGVLAKTAGGIGCLTAAGGVWLIRNWIQFGSPVAPAGISFAGLTLFPGESFARSTYFSVLGEMQRPGFDVVERLRFFGRLWFGAWFLPALLLLPLFGFGLFLKRRDRERDSRWWPSLALLIQTALSAAVLLWWLAGAPWTALQRSGGLTLRYVLPIAALLPLISYVTLFPASPYWQRRPAVQRTTVIVVMAAAALAFWQSSRADPVSTLGLPAVGLVSLLVAGVVVIIQWFGSSRRMIGWLALSVGLAMFLGSRSDMARARAAAAFQAEEEAYATGSRKPRDPDWREGFLAVRAHERLERRDCRARRFLTLVRYDEPLALQPDSLSSRVYYAGRDLATARRLLPVGSCDYVITTRDLEATDKGRELVSVLGNEGRLRSIGTAQPFVIYAGSER